MNDKLDESQKILHLLLEKQSKDFPKFYFQANDNYLNYQKIPKCHESCIKKEFFSTIQSIKKKKGMYCVDKQVKEHPGQLLITACQLTWSGDCPNVLNQIYNSENPQKIIEVGRLLKMRNNIYIRIDKINAQT